MDFLRSHKFSEIDDIVGKVLKFIQLNYIKFYSIILANAMLDPAQFLALGASIAQAIPTLKGAHTSADEISHGYSRCFTTRFVMEKILHFDEWTPITPINDGDHATDVYVTEVNLGGETFPDHTFLLLTYRDNCYLIQSYYYSYLFGGKYGLIKLDQAKRDELLTIINKYEQISDGRFAPTPIQMISLNKSLEEFTGVDASKHARDMSVAHVGNPNYITLNRRFVNVHMFYESIKTSIDNILRSCLSNFTNHRLAHIPIKIDYRVYDAFRDRPLLVGKDHMFELANIDVTDHFLGYIVGTARELSMCKDGTIKEFAYFPVKIDSTLAEAQVARLFAIFNRVWAGGVPLTAAEEGELELYERF